MTTLDHAKRLLSGILLMARRNKVYWIIPLALTLLLAVLVILGNQSSAPFVYTLF
jgi:uncharacterized integral membrane protein